LRLAKIKVQDITEATKRINITSWTTKLAWLIIYANYLKFYERARTEMLRAMGFEQDELMAQQNILFVVRSVQVDYLQPAKFNDLLDVSAALSRVKSASLIFAQTVMR
jgi:acyl-CoA thioester hydrolase